MWEVLALGFVTLIHPVFKADPMKCVMDQRLIHEEQITTHFKAGFDSLNVRFVG